MHGCAGGRVTGGRLGWHWLNVCRWGLLISNHLGHKGQQGKRVGQLAQGTVGVIGVRCLLQNQPIYTYVHVCVGMNARLCVPGRPFANSPEGKRTLRLTQPYLTRPAHNPHSPADTRGRVLSGVTHARRYFTAIVRAYISLSNISMTLRGRITQRFGPFWRWWEEKWL